MFICTYCKAPGDKPRCDNCGAPTERIAERPALPQMSPTDLANRAAAYAWQAEHDRKRGQPRISEPFTVEEIAAARNALGTPE